MHQVRCRGSTGFTEGMMAGRSDAPRETTASSTSPVLARASGVALVERDGKLHFVRYLHETSGLLLFLLLLASSFVVLSLPPALIGSASPPLPWPMLGALFAVMAIVWGLVIRRLRRRRAACAELPSYCSLDPHSRMLSIDGETVGPVTFRTGLQLASSSPKLVALPPAGRSRLIVRGDPFLGGLRPLIEALRRQRMMD
jgi:hypothetical protein